MRAPLLAAGLALLANCLGAPAPRLAPDPGANAGQRFAVREATIQELQGAMEAGRVTSQELVQSYLDRIAAFDRQGPRLNTMIRIDPNALAEAAKLDVERRNGHVRGPLHGIPIVVKDNYDTQGLPTSAGAMALSGSMSSQDAYVVAKLRAAGAVLLGKTNMNEFALGITTTSSITGQTLNPYDPSRYPGGSSGGTAAAVAASFATVGWGTDTCGSIRVPAGFNNLFALRPTKGLTSIMGVVPLCHTQDVTAPVARTVRDLAIALDATVGFDPADEASRPWATRPLPRFEATLDAGSLTGARFGVVRALFGHSARDAQSSALVNAALASMTAAGAQIIEVPGLGVDSLARSASVIAYEFREDLAAYLKAHPTAPVRSLSELLQRGLYLQSLATIYDSLQASPGTSSSGYRRAVAQRAVLQARLTSLLSQYHLDALVFPTARAEASIIGDVQDDPNCELSANSGFPAMSVPVGFTSIGTPIGMELLGAPLSDARLVSIAYAWEQRARPRQAPTFAPVLGGRMAPPPVLFSATIRRDAMRARVAFSFVPATGELGWTWQVDGIDSTDVLALNLHQAAPPGAAPATGPVIAVLGRPGSLHDTGRLVLTAPMRGALDAGQLYVTLSTTSQPGGELRAALLVPPPPPNRQ
jgi:amidase